MPIDILSRASGRRDPVAEESIGVDSYQRLSSRLRKLVGRRTADTLAPREDRRYSDSIGEQFIPGAMAPAAAQSLTRSWMQRAHQLRRARRGSIEQAIARL